VYKISLYNKKHKNYALIAFNLFKKEFYLHSYEKMFENGLSIPACWHSISNFHIYWVNRIKAEERLLKNKKQMDESKNTIQAEASIPTIPI